MTTDDVTNDLHDDSTDDLHEVTTAEQPEENAADPRSTPNRAGDRPSGLSRRGLLQAGVALGAGGIAAGMSDRAAAAPQTDPSDLDLYLLFGQSNMEGQGEIEPQDRETHPRVHVLADKDCSNLGREYGQWYLAEPPLNRCWGRLGPGDYFGKSMIGEMAEDRGIGLVPAAVSGADIALFEKGAPIGRNDRRIPEQFDGGYQWLVDLAEIAQDAGTIKGILFHQGETNTADQAWTDDVRGIVENLRADLGIGTVPFLAGEMLYAEEGGCCGVHNREVNELPEVIDNAHVVSAEGLEGQDNAHFTAEAYRELGRRYAYEMVQHVDVVGDGSDILTDTPTPTPTATPTERPTPTPTATPTRTRTEMPSPTRTEAPSPADAPSTDAPAASNPPTATATTAPTATETASPTDSQETTSGGGPGFGVLAALGALGAGAWRTVSGGTDGDRPDE